MAMDIAQGRFTHPKDVAVTGTGTLPSVFDVSGFAVSTMAEAAVEIAQLARHHGFGFRQHGFNAGFDASASAGVGTEEPTGAVSIDRGLAALWFGLSFEPIGWELPPVWDAIAGDYRCADGWIRLHTNAAHHRAAALQVLGLKAGADRPEVAAAVAPWSGEELEAAVVAANGCAALMRSPAQWRSHPQGRAVASEPLVGWGAPRGVTADDAETLARISLGTAQQPLQGVRVLDLTRVIAGPAATRFLAMYGAQVLRIDPPDWKEPGLEAEMTVGKHCAHLDLRDHDGMATLRGLLAGADLFIHGYRPDALDKLGLSEGMLAKEHPNLIDVGLDAYGWSGPWAHRRGFDSLVQMSCGIAHEGREHFGTEKPFPLPVQALDHATGYLCAAAAVSAWRHRLDGTVRSARLSLARTAVELMKAGPSDAQAPSPPQAAAFRWLPEETVWGPGRRLPSAVNIEGVSPETSVRAGGFGSAPPRWQ